MDKRGARTPWRTGPSLHRAYLSPDIQADMSGRKRSRRNRLELFLPGDVRHRRHFSKAAKARPISPAFRIAVPSRHPSYPLRIEERTSNSSPVRKTSAGRRRFSSTKGAAIILKL